MVWQNIGHPVHYCTKQPKFDGFKIPDPWGDLFGATLVFRKAKVYYSTEVMIMDNAPYHSKVLKAGTGIIHGDILFRRRRGQVRSFMENSGKYSFWVRAARKRYAKGVFHTFL